MLEKIYTIPINEAFDAAAEDHSLGCPFCALEQRFEKDQLEIILGASMMEPDIRIKTNEQGFCHKHYEKMFHMKNRLGMALMLESHLNELREEIGSAGISELFSGKGTKAVGRIEKLEHSCYICERVEYNMQRMFENAAGLWAEDKTFDKKISAQPYFCLEHYRRFIEAGQKNIHKKRFGDFYNTVSKTELAYFDKLREDISWFCKKFDYRYENEPWKDSKDAVERAIAFLTGKE
ncbi:MAG: hypothetical protein E7652_00845 [Ruminococcaceae bacterium]|nr:hypothetical protein [Oscillospiraceae bacterium]